MRKKIVMNEGGFTLIELILVITVLGILAASVLPGFLDVSENAKEASRDGTVGAVNSGIAIFKSDALVNGTSPLVPADLDTIVVAGANIPCDSTNLCFDEVINAGVDDTRWEKSAALVYEWRANPADPAVEYTYDTLGENFVCTANCV